MLHNAYVRIRGFQLIYFLIASSAHASAVEFWFLSKKNK